MVQRNEIKLMTAPDKTNALKLSKGQKKVVVFKTSLFGLALSSLLWSLPPSQAREPVETAGNAATVYRQAIELLPKNRRIDWLYGRCRNALTEEETAAILKSYEPSLRLACRAAAMPQCDWERPAVADRRAKKPRHREVRFLALAALRRGEASYQDDPKSFVDDALAAMAMARHLGQHETFVPFTIEIMLEGLVIESLAWRLPELPDDALTELAIGWRNLPPGDDFCTAVRNDKQFLVPDELIARLRLEIKKEEAARESAPAKTSSATEKKPPHGKATEMALRFLLELHESSSLEKLTEEERQEITAAHRTWAAEAGKSLPAMVLEADADYNRWVEGMCLPAGEFEPWIEQFHRDLPGLNPLSRSMIPNFRADMRTRCDYTRMRSGMLQTAIQVVLQGPEAVKHSVDPFGKGPLAYKETADGFELQSIRKSLKLSVGSAPDPNGRCSPGRNP